MGQTVYADLLFLVNFSMDLLCFFVTARLLRRPFRIRRCILAAAMGGVYSVAILFVKMNSVLGLVADLGFCALMCLCAYGIKDKKASEFILHTTVYFGVSMGTGGCMTAMYSLLNKMDLPLGEVSNNPDGISVWLFGLLAAVSGAAAMFGGKLFKNISIDTVSDIEITYRGVVLTVRGITDTGNMLKDPIGGKPVIIVDATSLQSILSKSCIDAAIVGDISAIISEDSSHKVRLIPMHTASGSSVACAFVPERIRISVRGRRGAANEKYVDADAIFAPARLCLSSDRAAKGCSALIPADITY